MSSILILYPQYNIVGIKSDSRLRGTDLRQPGANKKEIYSEMESPIAWDGVKYSIMVDGLKLIYTMLNRELELFDMKTDPHENHNLIGNPEYMEDARNLYAGLKRIHDEDFLGLEIVNKPRQMSADELRKMRSLGYVQ